MEEDAAGTLAKRYTITSAKVVSDIQCVCVCNKLHVVLQSSQRDSMWLEMCPVQLRM